MNLNVKNVDAGVAARLAEQAAAEGMSQQEWLRLVLRRTAERLSPAELVAQRAGLTPMTDNEFSAIREVASARRRSEVARLGASGSRR